MKYGYEIATGREISRVEYVKKLKSINNALSQNKRITLSLFDKYRKATIQ